MKNVTENHCKSSHVQIGLSEGRRAANSCIHFPSGSLIKRFRLLCNEHRCSCAKQASASSCGLFIMLTLTLTSVRLNHYISMSKHSLWPLCADLGSAMQSRGWCETISRQQIVDWSFGAVDTEYKVIQREEHSISYVKDMGLIHRKHTHTHTDQLKNTECTASHSG